MTRDDAVILLDWCFVLFVFVMLALAVMG